MLLRHHDGKRLGNLRNRKTFARRFGFLSVPLRYTISAIIDPARVEDLVGEDSLQRLVTFPEQELDGLARAEQERRTENPWRFLNVTASNVSRLLRARRPRPCGL